MRVDDAGDSWGRRTLLGILYVRALTAVGNIHSKKGDTYRLMSRGQGMVTERVSTDRGCMSHMPYLLVGLRVHVMCRAV